MAGKKHIRLRTAGDVRELLAKLINERRRGQANSSECRDIGFLCKILLDSIEAGDVDERLAEIEKKLEEKENECEG